MRFAKKKKEMLLCNVANCGDWVLVYMLISLIIMCFSLNFGYIVDTVAKIETGAANFLYFMQCHSFSGIFNTFFFLEIQIHPNPKLKSHDFTIGRLMIPVPGVLGYVYVQLCI